MELARMYIETHFIRNMLGDPSCVLPQLTEVFMRKKKSVQGIFMYKVLASHVEIHFGVYTIHYINMIHYINNIEYIKYIVNTVWSAGAALHPYGWIRF